ncbi:unnamed protein product [Sphenostylis stenocarpa]|uniref:Uncharacterized protein n=1 Tax=Sphenostylis stenocarpa TaxID=92480 RepID=A0AA86T2J6_9FABA|nr:unnamed protein product [Sphenostylis stenocarpa]
MTYTPEEIELRRLGINTCDARGCSELMGPLPTTTQHNTHAMLFDFNPFCLPTPRSDP